VLEGEAEVFERHDPVQLVQLVRGVGPIATAGIDAVGNKQPDRVIVPQHPHRDLSQPGKVRNQHSASLATDTVSGTRDVCSAGCRRRIVPCSTRAPTGPPFSRERRRMPGGTPTSRAPSSRTFEAGTPGLPPVAPIPADRW